MLKKAVMGMKKKKIGSCAAVIVAAGSGTRMSGRR